MGRVACSNLGSETNLSGSGVLTGETVPTWGPFACGVISMLAFTSKRFASAKECAGPYVFGNPNACMDSGSNRRFAKHATFQ